MPEQRLLIYRINTIRGRVVDDETGAPIKGLPVTAGPIARTPGASRSATTDADGRFTIQQLPPGDYALRTMQEGDAVSRILLNPSKEQAEKVVAGYAATYWPKAARLEDAVSIEMSAGQDMNVGEVRLRRVKLYSALLSIDSPTCKAGEKIRLMFVAAPVLERDLDCNPRLLISGLQPETYTVSASIPGRTQEDREYLRETVVVNDRNVSRDLFLSRGVDIDGKVVAPPGTPEAVFGKIRIVRLNAPAFRRPDGTVEPSFVSVNGDGTFRLVNMWDFEDFLSINGLTHPLYVKKIEYDGKALEGTRFRPSVHAQSQVLEITLGGNPASVTGRIADRNGPLTKAAAVLVWDGGSNFALTDALGNFSFQTVPPGEYRILAVAPDDVRSLMGPDRSILERLAKDALKVKVSEGETRSVFLEPVKP